MVSWQVECWWSWHSLTPLVGVLQTGLCPYGVYLYYCYCTVGDLCLAYEFPFYNSIRVDRCGNMYPCRLVALFSPRRMIFPSLGQTKGGDLPWHIIIIIRLQGIPSTYVQQISHSPFLISTFEMKGSSSKQEADVVVVAVHMRVSILPKCCCPSP